VLVLALLPLVLAACGNSHHKTQPPPVRTGTLPPPPPLPTTSSSTTFKEPTVPVGTLNLTVYFLRDGKLAAARRTIRATRAVGTAAIMALAQGTTRQERAAGLRSAVPRDYKPSLAIRNGLATLAPQQFAEPAVAEFVYTLTQFPTIRTVQIGADGKHFSRASFERYLPPILIQSPVVGDTVQSPLEISGSANTFEGTFQAELRAAGRQLLKKTIKASSGSGTRGSFVESIPFHVTHAANGVLLAYAISPANGRPTDVVRIPVRISP
jgi:immunoglobulin-like protein involved in spore germination/sporulation and spore germination protein